MWPVIRPRSRVEMERATQVGKILAPDLRFESGVVQNYKNVISGGEPECTISFHGRTERDAETSTRRSSSPRREGRRERTNGSARSVPFVSSASSRPSGGTNAMGYGVE